MSAPDQFFSNPETERARQFIQRYAGNVANARLAVTSK